MGVVERLAGAHPIGSGLGITLAAIVVLVVLRALYRPRRLGGGTLAILLVALALNLLTLSVAAAGLDAPARFLATLHLVALVTGVTGLACVVVFELGLNRRRVRVPSILRNLVHGGATALVLVWIWRDATNDIFSLVTTSAVLAALGFALQGTIANLFAGLSLQLDGAFQIGQWIAVGDVVGRILEVRWRNVLVQTRDGDVVIVPNSELVSQRVTHLGGPASAHRIHVRIGFHYRHPPNVVRQALLDAARDAPGVLRYPEPDCLVADFGDSAIVYELRVWIESIEREMPIAGEVRARLWYAARRGGLEIPYPIRTLVSPTTEDAAAGDAARTRHAAALAGTDIFAQLEPDDRALLARGMREQHFAAGEAIIRQGEVSGSCYVVGDGRVSVRLGVDGMEREVAQLGPGQLFGEMSLVTGEPRSATVVAVNDVRCHVVDREALRQVLDARPAVAERLSAVLAARQIELDAEREGLTAAARSRREAEERSRLLRRIRSAFHLE